MFPPRFPRTPKRRARAGFSLIEVSLALVVAAGGLLSIFALFPVSLRQSKMAERDMSENAFATTLLETMAGNARMIDDVAVWNNPDAFLRAALGNTGLLNSATKLRGKKLHQDFEKVWNKSETRGDELSLSPDTVSVAAGYEEPDDGECIWYVGREDFETDDPSSDDKLVLPPQFLIRFAVIRREARARTGTSGAETIWQNDDGSFRVSNSSPSGRSWKKVWLPNVYVVSVVSTDGGFPESYVREPLYSQEFIFLHRP